MFGFAQPELRVTFNGIIGLSDRLELLIGLKYDVVIYFEGLSSNISKTIDNN